MQHTLNKRSIAGLGHGTKIIEESVIILKAQSDQADHAIETLLHWS